jgi:putative nucleotidyltransferase with HDIG domain
VRRFFGFIAARPLTPREQSEIAGLLDPGESALFFEQQMQDQRHALIVARRVLRRRPGDRQAARAALLHDVGKIDIRMGAPARSLATVLDLAGLPLRGRWQRYRRHAALGAEMLEEAGSHPLVVEFARRHPGPVPEGLDAEAWDVLLESDHG